MNSSVSAFSSSEAEVIERDVDIKEESVTLEQIFNESHKRICCGWIRQNNFQRVCLQFPDCYLPHSDAISDNLKLALNGTDKTSNIKIFVLADTSYGSCCVDEIAAAHVEADSIIHFGIACRSKSIRLPVLYMYPQFSVDINEFIEKLKSLEQTCREKELCMYVDIGYHHMLENSSDDNIESLNGKIKSILPCSKLQIEVYPQPEDNKSDYEPDEDRVCVFLGADNNRFFNLSLTSKAMKWFVYDPSVNRLCEKNPLTANFIRRRYFYIEKCKDAKCLGLIVATLTSEGYLNIITRLQEMAKRHGVRTQIIAVGRLNPAKLANFLEIDCFVLIGCPFNNIYTSKEYYKPIVTVFEAEMALNPAWYMKYPELYVTDFKQLLPEGRSFLEFDSSKIEENDISLISGRIRGCNDNVETADVSSLCEQSRKIITQPRMEVMTTNTGLTLDDRTWKGLDPAIGMHEPAKIQKGLSGIPIKYNHD